MKRSIAAFALAGLLSASVLAASEGAPAATAGEPARLCLASAPAVPEMPDFFQPVQRLDSCFAYCPDGSPVSCTGPWEYCDIYVSCSTPYVQCAARCFNTTSYCPGYGPSNCGC